MRPTTLAIALGSLAAIGSTSASARPVGREPPALGPSDVPALLTQLEDPAPSARSAALTSLRRVRPFEAARPALKPVLERLAHDKDPQVRREAAATLGGFGAEATVLKGLAAAMEDPAPEVQQAAIAALPLDVAALPLFRTALGHAAPVHRRLVANNLRAMKPVPETLALLALALGDADAVVRSAAAQSAATVGQGQPSLGPAIIAALAKERETLTRSFLLRALVASGGATPADLPLLSHLLRSDDDEATRYGSAQAIAGLGARASAAIPSLRAALEQDRAPLVRGYAAEALGKIGPAAKEAIPALIAIVRERERTNYRSMALTALAAIDRSGRAAVDETLLLALSDAEEETQGAALSAVASRGKPTPALRRALTELRVSAKNLAQYQRTMSALGLPVPEASAVPSEDPAQLGRALGDADVHARSAALLRARAAGAVDPSWIPRLSALLADADTLNRRYAAELLGRAGPAASSALEALVAALNDSTDAGLQAAAAAALVKIAPESPIALEGLGRHLLRGEPFRADASAYALAAIGARGLPALIQAVRSPQPYACFAASRALARLGPSAAEAVPALIELLYDRRRLTIQLTDGGGSSREAVRAALRAIAPEDLRVRAALAGP